jgi:hypothetical protein
LETKKPGWIPDLSLGRTPATPFGPGRKLHGVWEPIRHGRSTPSLHLQSGEAAPPPDSGRCSLVPLPRPREDRVVALRLPLPRRCCSCADVAAPPHPGDERRRRCSFPSRQRALPSPVISVAAPSHPGNERCRRWSFPVHPRHETSRSTPTPPRPAPSLGPLPPCLPRCLDVSSLSFLLHQIA